MSNIVNIVWEVQDGYCGGSRPQYLEIDLSDLPDNFKNLSESEQEDVLYAEIAENYFWDKVNIGICKFEVETNDDRI